MTSGVQLLSDLREVFGEADRISTEAILQRLHDLPESPWADIYGKPLNDRGLASRLRKYGVKPKVIRVGWGQRGEQGWLPFEALRGPGYPFTHG